VSVSFENAVPSYAHYALAELNRIDKLHFLISQNIDGLHMRSGYPINRLAELHGNMFVEKCNLCSARHINATSVKTIGLKPTGKKCLKLKAKGNCRYASQSVKK
jgi:mono-ADP-ribosyltransferase sirtuin 6